MAGLRVAWVGLGNMGAPLAVRVARHLQGTPGSRLAVYDLAESAREKFAAAEGAVAAASVAEAAAGADVVFLCLPNSKISGAAAREADGAVDGARIVDVTSGDPEVSKDIAASLKNASYVDLAVSGGPGGAAAGTVSVMVGGADADVAVVEPLASSFAGRFVHLGSVGAGHATKAVNNTLNSLHLAAAGEGLVALKKGYGVDPAKALAAINAGSGRSLQTEVRVPVEVLTGAFGYGFALALMEKDVKIGASLVRTHCAGAKSLPAVESTLADAVAALGGDFDYTGIVKHIEATNGVDLRSTTEV